MIRPSSLAIARKCLLAPYLSAKYPTSSVAAQGGTSVDDEITAELSVGKQATDPSAKACLRWFHENHIGWKRSTQVALACDLEIAGGTPDLVVTNSDGRIEIIDWKARGQWDLGRIESPGRNPQLLAYACHVLTAHPDATEITLTIVLHRDGDCQPISAVVSRADVDAARVWIIELQRRYDAAAVDDKAPPATLGTHCSDCYQLAHCPQRAPIEGRELATISAAELATQESAEDAGKWLLEAAAAIKAAEAQVEHVETRLRQYVLAHGPVTVAGKRYEMSVCNSRPKLPTLAELEAAGLSSMITYETGESTRWTWKRAK